jgi:exonuclease 3'-5' domain-containing protein 1
MENASRSGGNKKFVHGLVKCIREDSRISPRKKREWEAAKDKGLRLFAPEKGGRHEVFNERPLRDEIEEYYVQDVRCLPGLYDVYSTRLENAGYWYWESEICSKTRERLTESMSEGYEPHGPHKALAPVWNVGEMKYRDEYEDTARD